MRQLLEHRFPADSARLEDVRRRMREALAALACSEEFVETSVLAVDEAITNILRHGDGTSEVLLRVYADPESVAFRLEDNGRPVAPDSLRPRAPGEPRAGGFGLFLMQEIMDSVERSVLGKRRGNVLEMRRRLEQAVRVE